MTHDTVNANIMIIDDEPENLNVLGEMLRQEGWDVRAFPRGDLALTAARTEPPDLVLLDIQMPVMDGYDVCRSFKDDENLRQVPIIFLSAFVEAVDKVRAFTAGGVDYVTKPFAEIEIVARVRTHLRMSRQQFHLEELVRQRVLDLAAAHHRLRIWDEAKTEWLNMLSHEMRTPLNGIFGITELMFMDLPPASDLQALHQDYKDSRRRIEKLIDDASTLAHINVSEDGLAGSLLDFKQLLHGAVQVVAAAAPAGTVQASLDALGKVQVLGEQQLLSRAFLDLLLTATHCIDTGEVITIEACVTDELAKVIISSNGKSLPATALETFFEVGGQRMLFKGGGDLGLGAALASRILRLFNGQVAVRNGLHQGLVMEISLPAA